MANTKKTAPKLTVEVQSGLDTFETMSGKIRFLASKNFARADIARILNIRYQWVRGVLETPLKKS